MVACGETAQHTLIYNGKYENGRPCSPKLLVSEAAISGKLQLRCSGQRRTHGISVLGISSHNAHALQVRALARTSLAHTLMKHEN